MNFRSKIPFFLLIICVLGSYQESRGRSLCLELNFQINKDPVEVLDKWMALQIHLMSTTIASFNGPFVRIYSYSGLAAYESVIPGIQTDSPYWIPNAVFNLMPAMPEAEPGKSYHWPSSLNAALAYMNRMMFAATSLSNVLSMDSLEHHFQKKFTNEADPATILRSIAFGKQVAQRIFEWSETDGYRQANNPYQSPSGAGKWIPTPPNFAPPSTPHWGRLRTMVVNSVENSEPLPPPSYSEDTASEFYKMIREVYDISLNPSPEQKALVQFWKDINPGFTAPGHWLNVMRQVFQNEKQNMTLAQATYTYALTGITLNDSWISCWKTRYKYNLLRPITYIRQVIGVKDWTPFLTTPPHPEYTSGFACMAGAVGSALVAIYGSTYAFTDHTYEEQGMSPRSFDSFFSMAREAAHSKFYGGIHYRISVDRGMQQGMDVGRQIQTIIQSKKEADKP